MEVLLNCGVLYNAVSYSARAVSFFAAAFECDVPHLGMSKVAGLGWVARLLRALYCGSHAPLHLGEDNNRVLGCVNPNPPLPRLLPALQRHLLHDT